MNAFDQMLAVRWPYREPDFMGNPQYSPPLPLHCYWQATERREIRTESGTVDVSVEITTERPLTPGDKLALADGVAEWYRLQGLRQPPPGAAEVVGVVKATSPSGRVVYRASA